MVSRAANTCILILALWASTAHAGWHTFLPRDGLASLEIRAILEDRSGSMWFATNAGVTRYDGATWRTFVQGDGLASNDVVTMLEDASGILWFGTRGGLSRFDGAAWRTITSDSGMVSNDVRTVFQDRAGRLWVGTGVGLSSRDNLGWRTYRFPNGPPAMPITAIEEDRSGNLWFGTDGAGAIRFDGVYWVGFSIPQLPDNAVAAIHADRHGDLWFGTESGVTRHDGSTWTTYEFAGPQLLFGVRTIAEDSRGNLWFGHDFGLSRFDGRMWRNYASRDGLANDKVAALHFDRSGNLWAGTDRGVSLYDRVSWVRFADAGLSSGVRAACQDSTGAIWFGTQGSGAVRYDGAELRSYSNELVSPRVAAIRADSSGAVWFATDRGSSRYDGVNWAHFDTTSGLAGDSVRAMSAGPSGSLWFATSRGLSGYDGRGWRSLTHANTAGGLPSDDVLSLMEDRAGNLWVGTAAGASRFDGERWTPGYSAPPLPDKAVTAMLEDRAGRIWFGTSQGLAVLEDSRWRVYQPPDLRRDLVTAIVEDYLGVLWVAIWGGGVSRFDGTTWHTFTTVDGLPDDNIAAVLEDASGDLWFGAAGGSVRHEPDRVPPQTIIHPPPPRLSTSTVQTLNFAAAFGETQGIEFSHSLDGSLWSPWSSEGFWVVQSLADGDHWFRVKARDALVQEDSTPVQCSFEVDATPPAPVLSSPAFGQPVRDSIVIRGTADDLRFRSFQVQVRPSAATSWSPPEAAVIGGGLGRVRDGVLGGWNTGTYPDGNFDLRLTVADTLGLAGVATISIQVDNHAPWADQTSPAKISAADGGDVYTTSGEIHLYFPPHAVAEDAIVKISRLATSELPDSLANGARPLIPGYAVSWSAGPLLKGALLDFRLGGAQPSGEISLYHRGQQGEWLPVGGTPSEGGLLSATITEPGPYTAFVGPRPPVAGSTVSAIRLTPRVFSPSGSFSNRDVGIGFVLGQAGSVSVGIYDRAGRSIREIADGVQMPPGANLVRWDGRDRNGKTVEDGVYIVVVAALGERRTQTLAVVK